MSILRNKKEKERYNKAKEAQLAKMQALFEQHMSNALHTPVVDHRSKGRIVVVAGEKKLPTTLNFEWESGDIDA